MRLLLNGSPVIVLRLANINFNDCVSRSGSVVLKLNTDDVLYATIPSAGGCYFVHSEIASSFSGLKLF